MRIAKALWPRSLLHWLNVQGQSFAQSAVGQSRMAATALGATRNTNNGVSNGLVTLIAIPAAAEDTHIRLDAAVMRRHIGANVGTSFLNTQFQTTLLIHSPLSAG